MQACFKKLSVLAVLSAWVATPVLAEPPMNVDDAGTLAQGGMKVEGAWSKDNKARGAELGFGYGPIENVELGLVFARETDRDPSPSTKARGTGISIKWVPIQNDTGWSLGLSFGYGKAHVNERSTPDKFTETEYALSGLATYRWENGQVLHMNLGATRVKVPGESEPLGTWGVGFEQPLAENLKLTAEVFGTERSRPDKAIGLRYEVAEGFKISGAVGRGNDRSFGQVGFSWEF